jgi:fatty acyl-CoA reductase
VGSQCFDRIKKIWGAGFDEYINKKVHAIAGDMLKPLLGLSPANETTLIETVNIIINCAASVDFNSKIHEALSINYYGTQRMLQLAAKCKHIENFMHMSTAYVNSNITGFIEERLYDDDRDVVKYVDELMGRCVNFTEKEQLQELGNFPNTYTFTKNLGEKMLKKLRPPTLQITIVRPTMVGAALRDPVPGWIDNIVGCSAMYFFVGIGVIKEMVGNEDLIGD